MANTIKKKKAIKKSKRKIINKEKNRILRLLKKEKDLSIANELMMQGYLRVSRRHGMLSRLDRKDWQEYMAAAHYPWSVKEGEEWVKSLGGDAEDHYRRCYSKDKIEVSLDISKMVQPSGWQTKGYIVKV